MLHPISYISECLTFKYRACPTKAFQDHIRGGISVLLLVGDRLGFARRGLGRRNRLLAAFTLDRFLDHAADVDPALVDRVQPPLVQVDQEHHVVSETGDPGKEFNIEFKFK